MAERSRQPWLATLIGCVAVAVVLLIWVNASGGYANAPWFLALGLGAGGTFACLWLLSGRIRTWGWTSPERMTPERTRPGDTAVELLTNRLANPEQAPVVVGPILRRVLTDRLDREFGLDPDQHAAAVRRVLPPELAANLLDGADPAPADVPRLLEQLALVDRAHLHPPTALAPPTQEPR